MFHHYQQRKSYPFGVSGNTVSLPPGRTLRLANLEVTGTANLPGSSGGPPAGNWGTTVSSVDQTYVFNGELYGTFILNNTSPFVITLPAPTGVGRWTFVRGAEMSRSGNVRIISPTGLLNGSIFQQNEDSVLGEPPGEGGVYTGIRFLGNTGFAGDVLTIITDGDKYYFSGQSVGQGFEMEEASVP